MDKINQSDKTKTEDYFYHFDQIEDIEEKTILKF